MQPYPEPFIRIYTRNPSRWNTRFYTFKVFLTSKESVIRHISIHILNNFAFTTF